MTIVPNKILQKIMEKKQKKLDRLISVGDEFCSFNDLLDLAMTPRRAEPITESLLHETILNDWFHPMQQALDKIRFSDAIFKSLPMASFVLFGGLRQLLSLNTLREQVQTLFHLDANAERLPVPRSTWSDAMASKKRRDILRQACEVLAKTARLSLPDKFAGIEGLGQRPVLAIDATYQEESSHYYRVLPKEGGCDNQKGHMLLTYYDLRYGIPIDVKTETESLGEMRVLKADHRMNTDWSRTPGALYIVDRAFIDGRYWDERKKRFKATVITRYKSILNYTEVQTRAVPKLIYNEQVVSDTEIHLACSEDPWRLIQWRSPEGEVYRYLTNDFTLEPGIVAFMYYRRWDTEKYFDTFKNDLVGAKAWCKSPVAIEQQALMGLMTYILTMLFVSRHSGELSVDENTQSCKQTRKQEYYLGQKIGGQERRRSLDDKDEVSEELVLQYDGCRAFWTHLSKITRQVWRFLKNCFDKKSSRDLYQRQLRPMLEAYI